MGGSTNIGPLCTQCGPSWHSVAVLSYVCGCLVHFWSHWPAGTHHGPCPVVWAHTQNSYCQLLPVHSISPPASFRPMFGHLGHCWFGWARFQSFSPFSDCLAHLPTAILAFAQSLWPKYRLCCFIPFLFSPTSPPTHWVFCITSSPRCSCTFSPDAPCPCYPWCPSPVLLFNPPYVPTGPEELHSSGIEAAWAGGTDGMEVSPAPDGVVPNRPHLRC